MPKEGKQDSNGNICAMFYTDATGAQAPRREWSLLQIRICGRMVIKHVNKTFTDELRRDPRPCPAVPTAQGVVTWRC